MSLLTEARATALPKNLGMRSGSFCTTSPHINSGFYAETEVSGDVVIKTNGKKSEIRTKADAQRLKRQIEIFDKRAKENGVRTPFGVELIVADAPEDVTLTEIAPYVGPDAQMVLASGELDRSDTLLLLQRILQQHRLVYAAGFPISLDAVLANFCIDKHGNANNPQVVYVDRMPPRQSRSEVDGIEDDVLEIPNPTDPEAIAVVRGRHLTHAHARVVKTQIDRALVSPSLRWVAPHVPEMIGDVLGEEAYRLVTPDSATIERILHAPEPTDVDTLRMVGWAQHHQDRLDLAGAQEVHKISHIGYGGALPSSQELMAAAEIISKGSVLFEAR